MKKIENVEELVRTLNNQFWIAVEHDRGVEVISTDVILYAPVILVLGALTEGKLYSCPN